jgi:hypothetical protein
MGPKLPSFLLSEKFEITHYRRMNPLPSGVYFLSQILLSMFQNNPQAVVQDFNSNLYSVWALLTTLANPRLLNAVCYWSADERKITYCQNTPGLAQPYPINGWVSAIAGPGLTPAYATPPPVNGQVEPHLYRQYN